MADKSGIAWTDATINPCYGCSKVSEACENCYAIHSAKRLASIRSTDHLCAGLVEKDQWTGRINLFPERMGQALRWQKPRRIFVGSMTDLFHESVPFPFLDEIFSVMQQAHWHTFQILTKRVDRMAEYIAKREADPFMAEPILPNVWLGVTVENHYRANQRIGKLLEIPAAEHFVSIEPMISHIDLTFLEAVRPQGGTELLNALAGEYHDPAVPCSNSLSWVICGCESLGAKREGRHMEINWVRSLRNQCIRYGTPFFLKQAAFKDKIEHCPRLDGHVWTQFPERREQS